MADSRDSAITRRQALTRLLAASVVARLGGGIGNAEEAAPRCPTAADTFGLLAEGKKIPVIFDTDIGEDIDDTWALVMLLGCPELEVRLVVADAGNTTYRARLLAKLLEVAERTEIPVGIGLDPANRPGYQSGWLGEYRLSDYPGPVESDGVEAIIRTVRSSADPVTLICVGAVPNIAEALRRAPDIVHNCRFVGMYGSVRRGYGNSELPVAEANVRSDPQALQTVFAAPWEITLTPLDTCGIVELRGDDYRRVFEHRSAVTQALMDNYRIWLPQPFWLTHRPDPRKRSTTLFDTVAIYLAFAEDLVQMEEVPLRVTDDGMTLIDPSARSTRCAMTWKDLGRFEELLVERLISA